MKLYLAYKDSQTLMEGTYENCLGVFESEEAAWVYLASTDDFEKSEHSVNRKTKEVNKKVRVYHFDGELSYFWYVKEVELNKGFAHG